MKYIQSKTFNKQILKEVLNIDKTIYPKRFQGSYYSVSRRFKKCNDMFIYAYSEDKLIGYICFFPIKEALKRKIVKANKIFDDNIKPRHIEKYHHNSFNDIFIISLAIKQDYQNKGIGSMLIEKMFDSFNNKKINSILTISITNKSKHLFKKNNFKTIKKYKTNENLLIYKFKEQK